MEQTILKANDNYSEIDKYLKKQNCKKIFVVFENAIKNHTIYNYFNTLQERLNIEVIFFNDFTPNPLYESVCKGVELFNQSNCDLIVAIGGGSAMDVAKCIKLYSNMDSSKNYLEQEIVENNIPFLAIPTTAGTGSEATKFAVIYYNGEKQSVAHESCIPETILFDQSLLKTLPVYQKKSTMLDAFSHSIESIWSVNSTDESKEFSKQALQIIIKNMDAYINEDGATYEQMLTAANLAGKAINISQTTAGHAMCYKLTSLYKMSHGHAATLVNSELLPYMIEHIEETSDPRGKKYLLEIFESIAKQFGCGNLEQGKNYIRSLLEKLDLYNIEIDYNDIDILTKSVNVVRLRNNPINLSEDNIREIYLRIIDNIEKRK